MGLLVLRSIINVLEVPLNPNITNVLEVLIRTIIDVLEAPLNRTITSHLEVFPMSLLRGLSTTMSKFKGYFELFFDLFWVLIHFYVIIFIIYCTFAGRAKNSSSGTTKPRGTTMFDQFHSRCLILMILFIERASLLADRLLIYARSYRFSQLNTSNMPMSTNQRKGALIWVMEFSRTVLPGDTILTCNQPSMRPQRMIIYKIATERP